MFNYLNSLDHRLLTLLVAIMVLAALNLWGEITRDKIIKRRKHLKATADSLEAFNKGLTALHASEATPLILLEQVAGLSQQLSDRESAKSVLEDFVYGKRQQNLDLQYEVERSIAELAEDRDRIEAAFYWTIFFGILQASLRWDVGITPDQIFRRIVDGRQRSSVKHREAEEPFRSIPPWFPPFGSAGLAYH